MGSYVRLLYTKRVRIGLVILHLLPRVKACKRPLAIILLANAVVIEGGSNFGLNVLGCQYIILFVCLKLVS